MTLSERCYLVRLITQGTVALILGLCAQIPMTLEGFLGAFIVIFLTGFLCESVYYRSELKT